MFVVLSFERSSASRLRENPGVMRARPSWKLLFYRVVAWCILLISKLNMFLKRVQRRIVCYCFRSETSACSADKWNINCCYLFFDLSIVLFHLHFVLHFCSFAEPDISDRAFRRTSRRPAVSWPSISNLELCNYPFHDMRFRLFVYHISFFGPFVRLVAFTTW